MKKLLLVVFLVFVFVVVNVMVDVIVFVIVLWDVIVIKDIISMLVVILLNFLIFQYVEGLNVFNIQDGVFDIMIQGQESVIDFELIVQVISNILINVSGDVFILDVGVVWNGNVFFSFVEIVLVNVLLIFGLESLMVDGVYNGVECVSDQFSFKFFIVFVMFDGLIVVIDYFVLFDGYWIGDVKVQFNVIWIMFV